MRCEGQRARLGDLVEIKHGYAFKGAFFQEGPPGDVLLTPGNFEIGGGFKGDKFKYYVGPVDAEYVLDEGDLIVTMTDLSKAGDTLGYPALVPRMSLGRYLHNQRLGRVVIRDESVLNRRFLYYVLCTDAYRHEVLSSATGSTVRHTSPSRIANFTFYLPTLDEQRRIAHILGTLDDKIELNRQMNQTLEEMARALFKSWFVDFDPVRAKMEGREPSGMDAETAALFPDRLVDSELGPIPEGWEVRPLGTLMKRVTNGVEPAEIEPGTPYIGLADMPQGSCILDAWQSGETVDSRKYRMMAGQILFGRLRPYFKKVGIAPVDGICSTDIQVIEPADAADFSFVLLHVSSQEFIDYTSSVSTGTRMPRAKWADMTAYEVVVPPPVFRERLNRALAPAWQCGMHHIFKSRELLNIRNLLLREMF